MVETNLREPGDNVISSLMENDVTEDDGSKRKLTKEEIFSFCKLVIFAGGGTTWRQLGITIYALLSHYQFWEACREDRTLIEQAVDESLRWAATDPVFPRLCVADTEVAGVFIPANSQIQLCLHTANHDPEVFENPKAYDIFRRKAAPLPWHGCRQAGDGARDQRADGPVPEPAPRLRRPRAGAWRTRASRRDLVAGGSALRCSARWR
jgi:cytochrome P450